MIIILSRETMFTGGQRSSPRLRKKITQNLVAIVCEFTFLGYKVTLQVAT